MEDDYDSEFRFAGPPLTALQGMDGTGRVAYLGTFAKILFPGLRIGYAVVPDALMPRVLALRALSDRQPGTLVEGALADFLDDGHFAAHLRRRKKRVQAARDVLLAALHEHGMRQVRAPEQGLHLVADLDARLSDTRIATALRGAGIGARALSPMYLTARPRKGLVLGFSGFGDAALRAAAAGIGDALCTTDRRRGNGTAMEPPPRQ